MDQLAEHLRTAAQVRGLLGREEPLDFRRAAELVRDMPYRRASDRRPETIVREWRGTCSGKHYVLDAVAGQLGLPSQLYHCTHRFTRANTQHFPDGLRALIPPEGLRDVHTFLRVYLHERWTTVDVTWPAALADLGFPANATWDGVRDMVIAADIEDEVPVRGDPQQMKDLLISTYCTAQAGVRDRFIIALTEWLTDAAV